MLFQNSSPHIINTDAMEQAVLFVLAQAARSKETVSVNQVNEAVLHALMPPSAEMRSAMKKSLIEMFTKRTLVNKGYIAYATPRSDTHAPIVNLTQRGKAYLARKCLDLFPFPDLSQDIQATDGAPRNLESGILVPMFLILSKIHNERGVPVKMTEIREGAKRFLNLSAEDLAPLKNRSDTKIDQLFRNVRSHNTFEKKGWVVVSKEGMSPTERGFANLLEECLPLLPSPRFEAFKVEENVDASPSIRPRMRRV